MLDFSEDKSSFLGLVDADVLAGTTTIVSKDAEYLVNESFSLGLVTAELHTETTAHIDSLVVESPACGFSTGLASVNADVHIRTTVKTDAIAASSVDACLNSGSPVHDVEFTGFAVSDLLSPCCSVFGSLNPNISFFYPWKTESAGLGPGSPDFGSLLSLCNSMYTFGSAVVASLGPGPPVPGSLLGLCNSIYALKSAVVAGLGPGPPVPGCLDLWNSVYALKSAIIARLGPGLPVSRSPDLLNPVYALGSATIAGLSPGPPAYEFLPFFDSMYSPKYTGSPTTLVDLSPVFCSYAVKRLGFDASVTSYLSVVLFSLCDNVCVLFPNESYCCAQEFLFMNCVTMTYNMLLHVIKILSLLLFVYHQYFQSILLPFIKL